MWRLSRYNVHILCFVIAKKFLFSLQKTDILLCLYGYTGKNCEKFKEKTTMKKEKGIIRAEGN